MNAYFAQVAVIGAGTMGRGIAQMAAQAGSRVHLFDQQASAVQAAIDSIHSQWEKMLTKGRCTPQQHAEWTANLAAAHSLSSLGDSHLVIEAIIERMDAKHQLFAQLEAIVSPVCVLASNTSSLSITTIAKPLKHPGRFAGLHYFNPVPLMKLVEVIPGLHTDAAIVPALSNFVRSMSHTPVTAVDMPGFIVNHAGRGYGTEALRVASESVADFATVDRILREQMGFKLGPFELLDLTGLDVSHAVMESIYEQFYDEARYRPSAIAAQRVAAGLLGRKTGAGFYPYEDGVQQVPAEPGAPAVAEIPPVWVSSRAARRPQLYQLLKDLGAHIETGPQPSEHALILVAPLGFDMTTVAAVERLDPTRTVGIDMMLDDSATRRRVLATTPATRDDMKHAAHALFASDGKAVSMIRDSGGFVTQRVVAHIVNIACDMCQQNLCTPADLETAVTLGLGYPLGPLTMGNAIGPTNVLEILFNLQTVYGDQRYRPSPWLRRRGAIGLSLLHEEA